MRFSDRPSRRPGRLARRPESRLARRPISRRLARRRLESRFEEDRPLRPRRRLGRRDRMAYTPMRGALQEQLSILHKNAGDLLEAIEATMTLLPKGGRGRLSGEKVREVASNIEYMKDFMTEGRRAMREIGKLADDLASHAESVLPPPGPGYTYVDED